MRRRPRKGIKKTSYLKVAMILLPFLLGGLYVWGAIYMIDDVTSSFLTKQYDSGTFITVNYAKLADWADKIEYRFEKWHMPANIALSVTFTDNNHNVSSYYHPTDNVALSTGFALATECFRYRAAVNENNTALKANATRCIERLLTGFSMLLAVPNGGIGPEYPGSISRFYWAPDNAALPGYATITNWMLDENEVRHFNGTGIYSNYRWRGYTSKDEMAGYLFGLGAVIQHCQNETDIWNLAGLLVAQIVEGFIDTNWLVINGDGYPCGSDMKSLLGLTGGEWILSLLRIAKSAYPDGRYDQLYHYFASKDMYMNSVARADALNLIMDYYAWNFEHKTLFNLITLEDDPNLKNFYLNQYINGIYNRMKYTRSPYFNMMYLVFTGENNTEIEADVFDQLMRFENNIYCRNDNATVRTNLTLNPKIEYYRDFVANNPIGMLYSPLISLEIGALQPDGKDFYSQPATVDMMYTNTGNFYERSPFEEISNPIHPNNNGLREGPGNTYTCVYWMGRAYGIIPKPP